MVFGVSMLGGTWCLAIKEDVFFQGQVLVLFLLPWVELCVLSVG